MGAGRDAEGDPDPAARRRLRRRSPRQPPLDRPGRRAGGALALARAHLPEPGWEVDVLSARSAPSAVEFSTSDEDQRRAAARARVMGAVGRASAPAFGLLGIRPEAVPLSTSVDAARPQPRCAGGSTRRPDVVLATGPPMAALLAGRAGDAPRLAAARRRAARPLGRQSRIRPPRRAAGRLETLGVRRARPPSWPRRPRRSPTCVRATPGSPRRSTRSRTASSRHCSSAASRGPRDRRSRSCTRARSRPTGRCGRC